MNKLKTALSINTNELLEALLKITTVNALEPGVIITKPNTDLVTFLTSLTYSLQDRNFCETDENFVQLLPYITLIDKHSKKVFMYRRGSGGGESRLLDLYSIGLGGHIEEDVQDKKLGVLHAITETIVKELDEEVGLKNWAQIHDLALSKLLTNNISIIYDERTEVNRRHLCLWMVLEIEMYSLGTSEEGIILNSTWLPIDELINLPEAVELESWSQVCANILKLELSN